MTVMDSALRESLKSLRLSGMVETLDARLAQVPWRRTRPPRLPPGPLPGRDHPPRDRRFPTQAPTSEVRAAGSWEEFDFAASSKLPAAQIRDLGALRWLHAGESVILFGPVGVGKTHIAQALGHLAVRQGAHVRFAKTSRILAELAGGHADRTWEKRIRELVRPDVLILDDFAMRQMNATQADDLYELVSERQIRHVGQSSVRRSPVAPGQVRANAAASGRLSKPTLARPPVAHGGAVQAVGEAVPRGIRGGRALRREDRGDDEGVLVPVGIRGRADLYVVTAPPTERSWMAAGSGLAAVAVVEQPYADVQQRRDGRVRPAGVVVGDHGDVGHEECGGGSGSHPGQDLMARGRHGRCAGPPLRGTRGCDLPAASEQERSADQFHAGAEPPAPPSANSTVAFLPSLLYVDGTKLFRTKWSADVP